MVFRQYKPSSSLRNYIKNYWVLERDDVPTEPEIIVPDGCIEIIFHYGQPYESTIAGQSLLQPHALVFGQIKNAIHLQPTGATGIFAIRFYPWGLYPFVGSPVSELTGLFLSLDTLFGPGVHQLTEQLQSGDAHSRVRLVEAYLLQILSRQKRKIIDDATRISSVISVIGETAGSKPIADLAHAANMSIRQFNRVATGITGLAPKQLARITRLQQFFKLFEWEQKTLTEALHGSGYYDQAHFIRDFKDIVGQSPTQFFKTRAGISDLMLQ